MVARPLVQTWRVTTGLRRLTYLFLLAAMVAIAACDGASVRAEIREDDSSRVEITATFSRALLEPDLPRGTSWEEHVQQWRGAAAESFAEELLSLDEVPDYADAEMIGADDVVGLRVTFESATLEELEERLAEHGVAAAIEVDGSRRRFEIDLPEAVERWMRGPALTGTGFDSSLELVLPGRIVQHNAHDREGQALRWSWTRDRPTGGTVIAAWDPTAGSGWRVSPLVPLGVAVAVIAFALWLAGRRGTGAGTRAGGAAT